MVVRNSYLEQFRYFLKTFLFEFFGFCLKLSEIFVCLFYELYINLNSFKLDDLDLQLNSVLFKNN